MAEVDENTDLYDEGHIPGAVKLHWRDDLQDPIERDLVEKADFEALLGGSGIGSDTTVVLYGDKNNWFAAYAYWYLKIYGHADVRILDGGRQKWIDEGRELTTDVPSPPRRGYSAQERDETIRARRDQVLQWIPENGRALVDVRSPQEYAGELMAPPGYEQEGASRTGHIPTAQSIPWAQAVSDDGTFKPADDLRALTPARASPPTRRSPPIAGSASAARTRGSSCTSCSASRTFATTTARGRSGATSSTSRSSASRTSPPPPPRDAETRRGRVIAPRPLLPLRRVGERWSPGPVTLPETVSERAEA